MRTADTTTPPAAAKVLSQPSPSTTGEALVAPDKLAPVTLGADPIREDEVVRDDEVDDDELAVARGSSEVASAGVGRERVWLRSRKDEDASIESVAYTETVILLVYLVDSTVDMLRAA
ncbi:MAG: hypothetical protein M1813_007930 [Trichoglossum hirsutum]|nr:MAG: hypothetical protein M1813_007930 [Trichoglossum hirsutum]